MKNQVFQIAELSTRETKSFLKVFEITIHFDIILASLNEDSLHQDQQ